MSLIEGIVQRPKSANICRHYRGLDLEIGIVVATDDEPVLTPEICQALATILGIITGVAKPVVYIEDKPYPAAKEAIDHALSQV